MEIKPCPVADVMNPCVLLGLLPLTITHVQPSSAHLFSED